MPLDISTDRFRFRGHAFTYVPDAAWGVALLGERPVSDNQVLHLPTVPALTGQEFIRLAADILDTKPRYMRVNQLMLRLLGLFNKPIAGTVEMYYQYHHDYHFNSTKSEQAFGVQPTSYAEGVQAFVPNVF